MGDRIGGSGAVQLLFGSLEILLAAFYIGVVLLKLLLEFGNLQHSEQLTLFHVRAPIHVQFLDVPGHLGVDVDLLVGLKLRSNAQLARKIFADGL